MSNELREEIKDLLKQHKGDPKTTSMVVKALDTDSSRSKILKELKALHSDGVIQRTHDKGTYWWRYPTTEQKFNQMMGGILGDLDE